MERENRGWIQLPRMIQQHWLWQERPYSVGQAWVDLLLMASYTRRELLLSHPRKLVEIPRGGLYSSQLQLGARWGWSRRQVRIFLNILRGQGMLAWTREGNGSLFQILCYEAWLGEEAPAAPDRAESPDPASSPASLQGRTGSPDTSPAGVQERARAPEKPVAAAFSPPQPDHARTASGPHLDSTRTTPGQHPDNSRTASGQIQKRKKRKKGKQPPQTACAGEQLPPWAEALPVAVVASELSALLAGGADQQLVEWAARIAGTRGKGWSYAQGIVCRVMAERTAVPAGPQCVGRTAPSYDPEEFDQRGFDLPPFPPLPAPSQPVSSLPAFLAGEGNGG